MCLLRLKVVKDHLNHDFKSTQQQMGGKNLNNRSNKIAGKMGWFDVDWKYSNQKVKQLQNEIAVAYNSGNLDLVKAKQNQLVSTFAAKAIAVRIVTSNKGKDTSGVDQILWDSPDKKFNAIKELVNLSAYKANPVKRVYIPKANGKMRPLGIPTMYDRAIQTLWKLALEPIAECTGDQHSYGYRPYRSTQDVAQILWLMLSKERRPMWVLEADIKGFFDNIHHEWIIEKKIFLWTKRF